MNKFQLLLAMMVCVFLSSPITASTSQTALQEVDASPSTGTWALADSLEYPIVYNNLEDFIDQMTNLHNATPDIGNHSSFAEIQTLDGIYDTLTNDNITVPEQTIYDPETGEPLYNQSAYESWRLDLEVGWANVDHDEINAELCVYGGIQADEALKVGIWYNGEWANVIQDVVVGWNNVSIAPSLVNVTLEMRFTGSNTGNTSIQNSWQIDAVLLHTWTTVYGSELTQSGMIQDVGNNLSRYTTSIGETNIWNGSVYAPYLWNDTEHIVDYAGYRLEFYDWYAVLKNSSDLEHVLVDDMRWVCEYWTDTGGGKWNILDLWSHSFLEPALNDFNMTFGHSYTDGSSTMNVTYTFKNNDAVKIKIDFYAQTERRYRFAWKNSGVQGDISLIDDGAQFEELYFNWNDVNQSEMDVWHEWAVATKKFNIYFGNRTVGAGATYVVDPTYAVNHDLNDNYWNIWDAPVRYDGANDDKVQTDGSSYTYVMTFRMIMSIVPYSTVTAASLTVQVSAESGSNSVTIERINAVSAAVLEGGSYPSIDTSPTGTILIGSTGSKTSDDIGDLVQEQLNQAGWTGSNQYIGFKISPTGVCGHTIEDYQKSGTPVSLSVTYEAPSANWLTGYGYRQGHSIDGSTGAGTFYQVKVAVEYGSGTSSGGTIYCNSHCDTDFDDIRFTDNDGQTELDYWMEEKTNSDDATFWVEVTDDLGSDRVIYCYYGKSGDSTTSNGDNTFLVFIDKTDTSGWTTSNIAVSTSGDYLRFYNTITTSAGEVYRNDFSIGAENWIFMSQYKTVSLGSVDQAVFISTDGSTSHRYFQSYSPIYNAQTSWKYYDGAVKSGGAWTEGTEFIFTIQVDEGDSSSGIDYRRYNTAWSLQDSVLGENFAYGSPTDADGIYMGDASTGAEIDLYVRWMVFRKCLDSEPVNYNWGREQPTPNNPPTNDGTPTIVDIDDGDNLYARYRRYEVTTYHKDLDGYGDIDYVQFYIATDAQASVFYGRFDQDTHVFSELGSDEQKDNWQLTGSTYSEHDTTELDITWKFYVEWECEEVLNMDVRCFVLDDEPSSNADWYFDTGDNWDIETRLDYSTVPYVYSDDSGTVDRGDLNEEFMMRTVVKYYGSSLYPSDTAIVLWASCAAVATSPWSDSIGSSGIYFWACDADDEFGLDTYTVKPVKAGGAATDPSLYFTTDLTADYIADQIVIQTTVSDEADGRANINANVEIRVTARLAYTVGGEVWLGAGDTVTLDGVSMNWDSVNSWWDLTRSKASVDKWNFYVNSSSETGHGITALNLNSKNVNVIWDRVEIYSIVAPDDHIGAGIGTTIQYLIRYDYESQGGVTGTFTTDTTVPADALGYVSGNQWNATINEAVGQYLFDGFTSCSESQYGLTAWTFTGVQEAVVFDTVRALAIEVSDDRCNYGSNQWVRVRFDYQSTAYGYVASWSTYPTITGPNGAITLSTDDGSGWWRGSTGTYSIVDIHNYNTNTLNNYIDVDSILSRSKGSYTNYTIWDRVEIYSITYSDNHLGITSPMTLSYSLRYDYDTVAVHSGGSYYTDETNDELFYQSGFLWQATANEPSVGSVIFNGFTSCDSGSGGYDLTAWTFTGSQVTVTWDRVRATAIAVEDDRGNYGTAYYVQVTFDYESAAYGFVTSWSTTPTITGPNGAIVLSSSQGSGVWRGTSGIVNSIIRHDYNTNTLNDFIDGDNVLSRTKGTFTDYTIWDRVEIYSITYSDNHLGIGYPMTLSYYLRYDYDNLAVDSGGSYFTDETNDELFYQSGFLWQATANEAGVGSIIFNGFTSCDSGSGGYDLTAWTFTGSQVTITWDRVRALAIAVEDDRGDYGTAYYVQVTFDYESSAYGFVASWNTAPTITGPLGAVALTSGQGSGVWRGTSGTVNSVIKHDYNTNTLNDFIDGDNVLSRSKGSFSDYTIWDRILIITTVSDDAQNRVNINDNVEIRVTAYLEYTTGGTHWLGSSDTLYLDDVSMSWDTGNSWFELGSRTHATVGLWSYYVNSSSANEATYGITVVYLNSQDVDVVWDQIEVYYGAVSDDRTNINEQEYPYFRLRLKHDNHLLNDGTNDDVWINSSVATWSAGVSAWYKYYTQGSVGTWNFVVTSASENTYGITAFDSASAVTYDQDIIWDRIEFYSSAVDDSRINVNGNGWTSWLVRYDYDDAVITSGLTAYLNGTKLLVWNATESRWDYHESKSSVQKIGYEALSASETQFSLTAWIQTASDTSIIWDEIIVQTTVSDEADGRLGINGNVEIRVTARLAYTVGGEVWLGSGDTMTLDDVSMSWDASNSWFDLSRSKASVGMWDFYVNSSSETGYGITVFDSNSQNVEVIWDRVLVTLIDADGVYLNLNTQVNLTASLEYEYDSNSITAGTFSLRYGSIYLTLTHDVSGNWTVSDVSSTSTTRTYDYVNGTAILYDITVVNMNGKSSVVYWGRIILTVWTNQHWTVINYNTTILATGVYEETGWTWNGTITTTNSSSGTRFPVESSVANYTFTIDSITDPDYSITGFTAADVWCIFDDAQVSSTAYYWVQYDVNAVWLIWQSGTWTWEFNGTTLDTGVDDVCIIQSYMNTTDDDWAIMDSTGQIGDLIVGAFAPAWYYVNLTMNCETTVNGEAYDWQVWDTILEVEILHSINIQNTDIQFTDQWIHFGYSTNWANATCTIWDNSSEVAYTSSEGYVNFPYSSVAGLHNITILINGTHSGGTSTGQTYIGSDTDYWTFLFYRYTVVETLTLDSASLTASDSVVVLTGHINYASSYEVFEDDASQATGNVPAGYFNVTWSKAVSSVDNVTVTFTYSDQTVIYYGAYEVGADVTVETEFELLTWDVSWTDYYVHVTWRTDWGNATLTPYEDGAAGSTTHENYTLQYLKSSAIDNHTLDFRIFAGGSHVQWKNYTYAITATTTYSWQYITIKDQSGNYIDYHNFNIFVNSTEIFVDRFYDRTEGYVFNITITDLFGDTLHMDNHTFSRSYEIELKVHSFQLVSELFEPVWIKLTSSGGGYKEVWLYREVPYEWWLYENKTYQWYWDIDRAGMGQPTGPHYYPTDGSWYTADSAMMYLMTGYGMAELKDDMPDNQGGGGDGLSPEDIRNITQSVVDDISALLDPLQGGSVGIMIVGGFTILSYLTYTIPSKVTKPKRKKTPEEHIEEQRRKQEEKRKKGKKKSKGLRSRLRPKKMRNNQ